MAQALGAAVAAGLIALILAVPGIAQAEAFGGGPASAPSELQTEVVAAVSTTETPPAWARDMAPVTHWYRDKTELTSDRKAPGNASAWKDTIGGTVFDTQGVGVGWHDDTLTVLLATHFPQRNVLSAGRLVAPADLALDLDGDGALETAVVLSGIRATGDRNIVRPGSVEQGQVYTVREWYRPDDLLHTTYGQGWRWTGPDGTLFAQTHVPVWMHRGELRRDIEAVVDWLPRPDDQGWAVRVNLRFLDRDAIPPAFALVWGTAVCGNDVIVVRPSWHDDMLAASALLPDPNGPGTGLAGLPRWDTPFPVAFRTGGVGFSRSGSVGSGTPRGIAFRGIGSGGWGSGGSGSGGSGSGGSGSGGSGSGGSGPPGGSGPGGSGGPGSGGPGPGGLGPAPAGTLKPTVVPEPNSLALFAGLGVALIWLRRRRTQ